jgi:hypothetical protein
MTVAEQYGSCLEESTIWNSTANSDRRLPLAPVSVGRCTSLSLLRCRCCLSDLLQLLLLEAPAAAAAAAVAV